MADPALLRHTSAYRHGFSVYLRSGRSIALLEHRSALDGHTSHHVWRTRGDRKVRAAHAANEGRIFAWKDPPPTGHPGQMRNCRCTAEPYVPGKTEFAEIMITSDLSSSARRWGNSDFVKHYYSGNGNPIELREIGHLQEIAEHYAYAQGAFSRLPGQIVRFAREHPRNRFQCLIENNYSFHFVQFSHGGGVVQVWVKGYSAMSSEMIAVEAELLSEFSDIFEDPLVGDKLGLGKFNLPFAVPYRISGKWLGRLSAMAHADHAESRYHSNWKKAPKYIGFRDWR